MFAAIGVILLLVSVSTFIIGLIRHYFPSTESFIPNDFKKLMSIRYAVYYLLAGILLVRFF